MDKRPPEPASLTGASVAATAELPPYVAFYDAVCVYCDGAVQQLAKADRKGVLRYASLQGETAAALRSRWPKHFPKDRISSMVFVDSSGFEPVLYTRAEGIRRIFDVLTIKPDKPRWLHRTPLWMANLGYRMFAATRYRRFGRFDECKVPEPELANRFLP